MNCLFCDIVAGKQPANIVFSDDRVVVFDDIHPQAPHHKLIIPKRHIATLNDLTEEDNDGIGHIMYVAKTVANTLGFAEEGYRVLFNCNTAGGQVVFHIHAHLLGGRTMKWPPG